MSHLAEHQEISRLNKSQRQFQFMLNERIQLVQDQNNSIFRQDIKLEDSYVNLIHRHINQYKDIAHLVEDIYTSKTVSDSKINQNSRFWTLNQTIEREVEDKLRHLKQLDIQIDNILNEQFDTCNQIEDIEESIRKILTKKEPNHISKAEPLLNKKNKCSELLQQLKQEKEKLKQFKLETIKQLLKLLDRLKLHREKRISYCKEKKLTTESVSLLGHLIKDLNQVTKKKQSYEQNLAKSKKLLKNLQFVNERIALISEEIITLFQEQEEILNSLEEIRYHNEEYLYFEEHLFKKLGLPVKELPQFLDKSSSFISDEQDKKKEYEQLLQGISTTNQTIKIFDHIRESIETENRRKLDLLKRLELLQKQFAKQSQNQQKINDLESQLQRIQLSKLRLIKKLQSKVDQADVKAYKTINNQVEQMQTNRRAKQIIIKDMRDEWSEKAKQLYLATNFLNEQFKDILSEVVPQIWFRQLDFSKQEAIKDLKLYLIKTFNRLNTKQ